MADTERCEELRQALADARARQSPPARDSALPGVQNVEVIDRGATAPEASPDLEQEIRRIEQALRDEGCEPE